VAVDRAKLGSGAHTVLLLPSSHPEKLLPLHASPVRPCPSTTALTPSSPPCLPLPLLPGVASKAGPQVEPFAASCFFRCIGLAERADQAAASGAFDPDEAAEFVVCALDLIRCAPALSLYLAGPPVRGFWSDSVRVWR